MKATAGALKAAAESYAKNIIHHGREDRIEGLGVMVVLFAPNVPPQYAVNLDRKQLPRLFEDLLAQVQTENLVILPKGGRT